MKSTLPKVLHPLSGRTLLGHAIAAAEALSPEQTAVVVRHQRDLVAAEAQKCLPSAVIVDQDDIPGTGRATQCAIDALDAAAGAAISGAVVVTASDVPLQDADTLQRLVDAHVDAGSAVTVLSTILDDSTGYGRILRDADGNVIGSVEQKDANAEQLAIKEINSGTYVFDADVLRRALNTVTTDNAQGEMYLPDVIAFAHNEGRPLQAVITDDPWTVEGTNDRAQLAALGTELNRRIVERWMLAGVTCVDPATTWIDVDVTLEQDVTLLPGVQLHGATVIKSGAVVGPDSTLTDTVVAEGASVVRTHAFSADIGPEATVGPFTYLRPGTVLGKKGKIGGFCETKNAKLGEGTKLPHLSYAGDVTIGDGTNIGAATIVANYDGVNKHSSVIGSHVRVGSDSVIVAPVTIGDGAYTAAGSVITEDVAPGALGIGRARQTALEGWTARKRPGTASDSAAQAASGAVSSSTEA
jgi:bifunctional UDP-N-acetylglucosamine pyrophosphorylase/glucosamine-1-phosphate N-acetyltransferase